MVSENSVYSGSVSFKYKGKYYECDYERRIDVHKSGLGNGNFVSIDQPKNIPDEHWDLITEELELMMN